jgi:hypothetical protein
MVKHGPSAASRRAYARRPRASPWPFSGISAKKHGHGASTPVAAAEGMRRVGSRGEVADRGCDQLAATWRGRIRRRGLCGAYSAGVGRRARRRGGGPPDAMSCSRCQLPPPCRNTPHVVTTVARMGPRVTDLWDRWGVMHRGTCRVGAASADKVSQERMADVRHRSLLRRASRREAARQS